MKHLVTIIVVFFLPSVVAADETWTCDADKLLELGISRGLTPSADGKMLELARGRLIEDDGPAAGYSYLPNEERLDGKVAIRKQLVVDDPRAFEAFLLVGAGGKLEATVNGKPQSLVPRGKAGNYWEQYLLPSDALRSGVNDIVLRGVGKIWIARDDERPPGAPPPNRSAKSGDGGRTWSDAKLGTRDDLDGEYYVRLFLDRYLPDGALTMPVLDRGNLADCVVARPLQTAGATKIELKWDAESMKSDEVSYVLSARTGTTLAPDAENWSAWRDISTVEAVEPSPHRFIQFRIEFKTRDPRQTPRLKSVTVESPGESAADWTSQLQVVEAPQTKIARSSIQFEYEPANHPRLVMLRKQHQLDEVVAGAATEWERILKLAAWSSSRWAKGHLATTYPRWDALDILRPADDGTPVGGFCQQYNLVFLQACESFGIRGRAVSIGPGEIAKQIRGGHEVVELWSNDYRKWVHVDGDAAWYFVDAKTRVPLSLLELHDRQLAAIAGKSHPAVEQVVIAATRHRWDGLTAFPPFVELRMIPRSNFLALPHPLPLNQGMRGWFWPGHEAWSDANASAARLYGRRVTTKNNWEWTLNETEIRLLATERPGEVRVELDTVTPGFAGYEATIDDGPARKVDNGFAWKLHEGKNRLTVRSLNETGPLAPTRAAIDFRP